MVRPPTMPPAPRPYQFHELVAAIEKRLFDCGKDDPSDAIIKAAADDLMDERNESIAKHQNEKDARRRIEDVVRNYINRPKTKGETK